MANHLINVLLIEDNQDDANLIQEILLDGVSPIFTFSHADRLNLGLQHITWETFEIVLLDLVLPDSNGLETFIQIHAVAPEIPILILTSEEDEGYAISAVERGAQDYLLKGTLSRSVLVRSIQYSIERKNSETEIQILIESMRRQSSELQNVLEIVHDGVLILNAQRELVFANAAVVSYLEYLTDSNVGEELVRLGSMSVVELLGQTDQKTAFELNIDKLDLKFEINVSPYSLGYKEKGWILLLRSNGDKIPIRSQEQDRQAAVGQLASGIAHDFNNIMGSIILYSEMLLNKQLLKGKDRERMATIMHQAQRAAALTRQILDFSRAGLIEPHRVDLVPFMIEITKLLSRTLPENIRLSLIQKDKFNVVNVDPVRIQQVFMNLAINARDAMPNGGELEIELEIIKIAAGQDRPIKELKEGDWVRVKVSDNGNGIHADVLPHIFEPFFTTKGHGESSGLGLAQVYGIIKQHGGHIEVASKKGSGTTFTLYLPAHPGPIENALIPDVVDPPGKATETLLVVEDDYNSRTAVSEALRAHKFSVLSAGNGQEALKLIEEHKGEIDLVLSDLIMPGMGGVSLFQQLRSSYPDIGMMVMTGYPMSEETRGILEEGGVTWLAKPIHSRSLIRAVRKVLQSEMPSQT
ncbi:MAG: response regulator [Chloroflexi bacterium]|nr:response regulator [Chloroflexota bacterium]